ncbi:hypothetical protein STCU_11110 [Strigomonas culicis]|uniref:Uncharacterized protein n=1 Tax=Strigomonas culicis TaxID=28005 RepID=S9UPS9_9TRYP|nr:hypothetical protein STCU_11110 [Strigomonas culicis]|eukprot:EPY16616.1 hypothetical protein STCU_11110 [Strigomonas culicis]
MDVRRPLHFGAVDSPARGGGATAVVRYGPSTDRHSPPPAVRPVADGTPPHRGPSAAQLAALEQLERDHVLRAAERQRASSHRRSASMAELVRTPKAVRDVEAQRQEEEAEEALLRAQIREDAAQTRLLALRRVVGEEAVDRVRVELLADHGAHGMMRELHFRETATLLRREAAMAAAAAPEPVVATRVADDDTAEEKRRVLRRVRREQCELASELESLSRELQQLVRQ